MCDYSLMMIPNRLAAEGEELVAHRFRTGTTGTVSCRDFNSWARREPKSVWQRLGRVFSSAEEPSPVVCIPPGAHLRLVDIPPTLRTQFCLRSSEDAIFTQVSLEVGQHRDALFFAQGITIPLQQLPEGQKLQVLSLSSAKDYMPNAETAMAV